MLPKKFQHKEKPIKSGHTVRAGNPPAHKESEKKAPEKKSSVKEKILKFVEPLKKSIQKNIAINRESDELDKKSNQPESKRTEHRREMHDAVRVGEAKRRKIDKEMKERDERYKRT